MALSNRERQAAWRDRLRLRAESLSEEIRRLETRIARLERQLREQDRRIAEFDEKRRALGYGVENGVTNVSNGDGPPVSNVSKVRGPPTVRLAIEERDRRIRALHTEHPDWSYRRIAREVDVTHKVVRRILG